jgi:hypothetical protein
MKINKFFAFATIGVLILSIVSFLSAGTSFTVVCTASGYYQEFSNGLGVTTYWCDGSSTRECKFTHVIHTQ